MLKFRSMFWVLLLLLSLQTTSCKRLKNWFSGENKKTATASKANSGAEAQVTEQNVPNLDDTSAMPQNSPSQPESLPLAPAYSESLPSSANTPSLALPVESAPSQALPITAGDITITGNTKKNVAEGSLFALDEVQAVSASGKPLSYQWSLVDGPAWKMTLLKPNQLQGLFKIENLDVVTSFKLQLEASDGMNRAVFVANVEAYPAKLIRTQHLGGMTRPIESLGDQVFLARGRTIEVYDAVMSLVKRIDVDSPVIEMSAFAASGKKYLYTLSESGDWLLIEVTQLENVTTTLVQKSAGYLKNIKVYSNAGELWATTTEKDSATLWNLADVTRPQAKFVFKGNFQSVQKMVLWGKQVFLIDSKGVHTLDASTGVLQASIPLSGKVNQATVFSLATKNFLMIALGDSAQTTKADNGVRVFEIAAGARLVAEKRYTLKGNLPVLQMAHYQDSKFILGLQDNSGTQVLRGFDFDKGLESNLQSSQELKLARLQSLLIQNNPKGSELLVSDGASFKRFKILSAASTLKLEMLQNSYSLIFAGAIQLNGTSLKISDFAASMDTLLPAFYEGSTQDLNKLKPYTLSSSALVADSFALSSGQNVVLTLEVPGVGQSKVGETAETNPESMTQAVRTSLDSSLSVLGTSSFASVRFKEAGSDFRPVAMEVFRDTSKFLVGIARSNFGVSGPKKGVCLLQFASEQEFLSLLKSDLSLRCQDLPVREARDLKFSKDGKYLYVAAAAEGLLQIELETKKVLLKNNPFEAMLADRVLLSHADDKVFVSFIDSAASGNNAKIQIYSLSQSQLGLWGQIQGLGVVTLPYFNKSGNFALSDDDVFLFVANADQGLWVYNLSDPAAPVQIAQLPTFGMAADLVVGEKFKKIYMVDLINGLEVAEFGF